MQQEQIQSDEHPKQKYNYVCFADFFIYAPETVAPNERDRNAVHYRSKSGLNRFNRRMTKTTDEGIGRTLDFFTQNSIDEYIF